jgi:hypothetical protein
VVKQAKYIFERKKTLFSLSFATNIRFLIEKKGYRKIVLQMSVILISRHKSLLLLIEEKNLSEKEDYYFLLIHLDVTLQ